MLHLHGLLVVPPSHSAASGQILKLRLSLSPHLPVLDLIDLIRENHSHLHPQSSIHLLRLAPGARLSSNANLLASLASECLDPAAVVKLMSGADWITSTDESLRTELVCYFSSPSSTSFIALVGPAERGADPGPLELDERGAPPSYTDVEVEMAVSNLVNGGHRSVAPRPPSSSIIPPRTRKASLGAQRSEDSVLPTRDVPAVPSTPPWVQDLLPPRLSSRAPNDNAPPTPVASPPTLLDTTPAPVTPAAPLLSAPPRSTSAVIDASALTVVPVPAMPSPISNSRWPAPSPSRGQQPLSPSSPVNALWPPNSSHLRLNSGPATKASHHWSNSSSAATRKTKEVMMRDFVGKTIWRGSEEVKKLGDVTGRRESTDVTTDGVEFEVMEKGPSGARTRVRSKEQIMFPSRGMQG
ncbi:hypothetical protein HK101_001390 [Irineochytrium annulatum]|nr:hypothetical protein HK101_001390 [Irineochytrium annulatum]